MENYFRRQIELWGLEKQKLLAEKEILIVGAGGLGSSLAFALGSIGLRKITIVDFDEVAIHNIHRQIAFKLEHEGKKKADIVRDTIQARSNWTEIESYTYKFETFLKTIQNRKFDIIFDATDNFETRKEIDSYSKQTNTPWVYGSVEEFYGQVCLFEKSSFQSFQTAKHKPGGVATPIVMMVASFQANLGLKYLLGDEVERDILYLLSFDSSGKFQMQHFKMPI